MDERLQNRIKKLQALAERGIGGEKIGANGYFICSVDNVSEEMLK